MASSLKLSVCIPTYNYGHYISSAIESVRSQTFLDFELLIIDDCSTDNTKEIVEKFAEHDDRIRFIRNQKRQGFAANFARCVEVAAGDYIKILCADDLLEENCLARMVKILDENSNVTLVSCSRLLVNEELQPLRVVSYANEFKLERGVSVIKKCLFKGNIIGEPTAVLFRKRDTTRNFDINYSLLVDLEMWFFLLEKGDYAFMPERLCKIRLHAGQATNDCIKTLQFINDLDRLYGTYTRKPYIEYSYIARMRWRLSATMNIWDKREQIINRDMLHKSISRYMNYHVASIIMPLYLLLLKLAEITRRLIKNN